LQFADWPEQEVEKLGSFNEDTTVKGAGAGGLG